VKGNVKIVLIFVELLDIVCRAYSIR